MKQRVGCFFGFHHAAVGPTAHRYLRRRQRERARRQDESLYRARVTIENAIGCSGNDRLIGDKGANRLRGGEGRDTFVFATRVGAVDRIEDFAAKDDMIELSRSGFKKLAVGDLPRAASKGLGVDAARVDASDRIIYDRGACALS
jgi:hypothetical protein